MLQVYAHNIPAVFYIVHPAPYNRVFDIVYEIKG